MSEKMNEEDHLIKTVNNYVRGESNTQELKEAMELFIDPYHNLAIRPILFKIWENDETDNQKNLPPLENPKAILDKIHHHINLKVSPQKENKTIELLTNLLRMTAVLIIGLFIGLLIHNFQKPEPTYYTSISPSGSISQIVLPDNTRVYLNSDSELKYTETGNKGNREVFLTGEAWFDVTKNENKPFVVHTPLYDVKVLGTQFNVKTYPTDDEIVTTLEKGSVKITSSSNITLEEGKTLHEGQQLILSKKNGKSTIQHVNTQIFTSWKDNQLIFINMK
ncbi:MAG: FecR family protein, partial [Bacteroidota bacterium]